MSDMSTARGGLLRIEDMPERSGLASWIPQLFYDLISRVMPGALLVVAFSFSLLGPEKCWSLLRSWMSTPAERAPSTFLIFVSAIAAAYFTGVLVRGISYSKVFGRTLLRWPKMSTPSAPEYRRYYRIKVALPAAGSRLAKHKAEASMATVLQLGLTVAAGTAFVASFVSGMPLIIVAAIEVLLAWSASRFRRHLADRFREGVAIHWNVLLDFAHPLGAEEDVPKPAETD